jgi:hypothetical protein
VWDLKFNSQYWCVVGEECILTTSTNSYTFLYIWESKNMNYYFQKHQILLIVLFLIALYCLQSSFLFIQPTSNKIVSRLVPPPAYEWPQGTGDSCKEAHIKESQLIFLYSTWVPNETKGLVILTHQHECSDGGLVEQLKC